MKSESKRLKKPRRIKSTTTMVWLYFALFTLVLFTVIGLVCYGVLGNAVSTYARRRLRDIGEDFMAAFDGQDPPAHVIINKIDDYSMSTAADVFFFVVAQDGESANPLFVNPSAPNDIYQDIYDGLISNVKGWEEGKTVQYNSRVNNRSTFNYGACVKYNDEQCVFVVRYPLIPIAHLVQQMEMYVFIVMAGALIVAILISYTIARKLSRPISSMSQTAQRLAAGDYSVQFNSMDYAEIAQLSTILNGMKDEIQKTDAFQKELLANVSHDLKTPLTMIKAYASMIQEISGADPEKREKHLQVIIDEADRLTGLVNDILSTSKIQSGIEQLNKKVFNLTELLYSVINSFSYLQEAQGYGIMVDVDPNLYTLADEEKIKQVIYNLVSNAVNYTGDDKTIYISLKFSPREDRIKFSVRDTGKGIDEEELEHIWDRYYRTKDLHSRPVKGTGLGLNIVKVILQNHSFNFGVNTAKGEGSTFYVDFPSVPSLPEKIEG